MKKLISSKLNFAVRVIPLLIFLLTFVSVSVLAVDGDQNLYAENDFDTSYSHSETPSDSKKDLSIEETENEDNNEEDDAKKKIDSGSSIFILEYSLVAVKNCSFLQNGLGLVPEGKVPFYILYHNLKVDLA